MKRGKAYEDKNNESRKLLEKLNENITRREEKYEQELKECLEKIKFQESEIQRQQMMIEHLTEELNAKDEEITKICQETERNKELT